MGLLDKFKKKDVVKDEKQKAPKKGDAEVKVSQKKEGVEKDIEKKVSTKNNVKKIMADAYKILVSPVVSEKASVGESNNVYTFKVNVKATKVDIKNAIKQVYGVIPKDVRIMNMEGKKMRSGKRLGRRQDWKKAMATLPKGQSINIHEGV